MYQVMAVDDDEMMLGLFGKLLSEAGYSVRLCSDGQACLQALRQEKPDLLLLDVDLGGADGIELCETIKKDPSIGDLAVVLVTGEAVDVDTRIAGLAAGAEDYILKPFDRRELLARIAGILRLSCRPSRS